MIIFKKNGTDLLMCYTPETGPEDWLFKALESKDDILLSRRAFHVRREIYRPDVDDGFANMGVYYRFIVGKLVQGYYQIDRRFLGIDYDLFMDGDLDFKRTTFVAETNIPIFHDFNDYGFKELRIGGDHPEALPREIFEKMLRQFPNTYELKKYARARVSSVVRNYVPVKADHFAGYVRYMERKTSIKGTLPREKFSEHEAAKFSDLVLKIESMLAESDGAYNESQWQVEILQVLLFLYPKYVKAFREAPVQDSLTNKDRSIDFLLVDASGYVDAVEIKKPFVECIVTSNRYRDNHVPMRELSGTVMQLEKYLYHLNRWGQAGEDKLNQRYAGQLYDGFRIKIVNPSGMVIMGRDAALTLDQRTDFEVIRRKYRHIVEIMTYDDLLRRLKVIRDQFNQDKKL